MTEVGPNTSHEALPVAGYTSQPDWKVQLVNINKRIEEQSLRQLDDMAQHEDIDPRWLAIGRTHLEQAWMAINRAVFKPQRVKGEIGGFISGSPPT